MKPLLQLLRTTLVGGLLFMVPIIVLVVILGKALAIAHKLLDPLAEHLPVHSVIGLRTPILLAIAIILLFCFLAGVLARTALAKKLVRNLETAVLANVPSYELVKGMGESMLGVEKQTGHQVVLARIEDAWQIAFLVERLDDGLVAVFVPGAPNPLSGSVYFMTQDRIKAVDIPPAVQQLVTNSTQIAASVDRFARYPPPERRQPHRRPHQLCVARPELGPAAGQL